MEYICDLHTHSVLSNHAYSSLTENIEQADKIGLKYYGISDHQPDDYKIGAYKDAFLALNHVPRRIGGVYVLRGCEFNILSDGTIDNSTRVDRNLDYGIASIHNFAYKGGTRDVEEVTNAYLKVLDIPYINIIGHMDDETFPSDIDRVVKKAKEVHKLVEINNSSLRPTSHRKNSRPNVIRIIEACKKYDQPIIINSDAHIKYAIGEHQYVDELIEELNFPKDRILNYNEELFKEYFKIDE